MNSHSLIGHGNGYSKCVYEYFNIKSILFHILPFLIRLFLFSNGIAIPLTKHTLKSSFCSMGLGCFPNIHQQICGLNMTCFNNPKQPKIEIFRHCIYKLLKNKNGFAARNKAKKRTISGFAVPMAYQNVFINKLITVLQVNNHNAH